MNPPSGSAGHHISSGKTQQLPRRSPTPGYQIWRVDEAGADGHGEQDDRGRDKKEATKEYNSENDERRGGTEQWQSGKRSSMARGASSSSSSSPLPSSHQCASVVLTQPLSQFTWRGECNDMAHTPVFVTRVLHLYSTTPSAAVGIGGTRGQQPHQHCYQNSNLLGHPSGTGISRFACWSSCRRGTICASRQFLIFPPIAQSGNSSLRVFKQPHICS